MRLTLQIFLTLDGVMQAPGGPTEDPSGGFEHGGWSFAFGDEDFGAAVSGWFNDAEAFLLGRKTYEIFAAHWPRITDAADPIATTLNALPKYVVSKTLTAAGWNNSTVVRGDLVAEVERLKALPGKELQVHGSGALAQALIEANLIDEYRVFTFPLHLGSGRKLFGEGLRSAALRLLDSRTTGAGVVIASYAPAGPVPQGSYQFDDE
jgi:dihydrofolate reductase